jgi:hypothetical protein
VGAWVHSCFRLRRCWCTPYVRSTQSLGVHHQRLSKKGDTVCQGLRGEVRAGLASVASGLAGLEQQAQQADQRLKAFTIEADRCVNQPHTETPSQRSADCCSSGMNLVLTRRC